MPGIIRNRPGPFTFQKRPSMNTTPALVFAQHAKCRIKQQDGQQNDAAETHSDAHVQFSLFGFFTQIQSD